MQYFIALQSFILINIATSISCWQYFTSLSDLTLLNSAIERQHVHSEYIFGKCRTEDKKFYAHIHLDHMQVLGKVIIRGWINIMRIPTCIILRATGYEEDTFRSTSYPFQICVPRITYCHSRRIFKYFYYEWYIPTDKFIGGMNWDIFLFGPPTLKWG